MALMSTLLLILRHNIKVGSDVPLAKAEISALCDLTEIKQIEASDFGGWLHSYENVLSGQELRFINRGLRGSGIVALFLEGTACQFQRILERASFIQEA